jgi:cytochrome b subunit of formate dehydrogenase
MFFTKRGRHLVFSRLLPGKKDALDPVKMLAYNFGLRKNKPHLRYPSYIEKMEYWALIWGSIVMMVTGALLVFNTATLRLFGTWMTDLATVVHFYEAVLATLAIVVWHFYWTIFDPDVYPMNMSWLIGRLRRKKSGDKEKHGQ